MSLMIYCAHALSRIAQFDQRTALPDQCLHSAEADVRPPRGKSGVDPKRSLHLQSHDNVLSVFSNRRSPLEGGAYATARIYRGDCGNGGERVFPAAFLPEQRYAN